MKEFEQKQEDPCIYDALANRLHSLGPACGKQTWPWPLHDQNGQKINWFKAFVFEFTRTEQLWRFNGRKGA